MPERFPWIAADPASQRLLAPAEKVAPAPTTLLITGESGSGKNHFARLVHERSFERFGGTEALRIEALLMGVTNTDLQAAVSAGHFREDLYFFLSALPI